MDCASREERKYKRDNNPVFFLGNKEPVAKKEELLAATQQKLADLKLRMQQDNGLIVGKKKESYIRCIEDCKQLIVNLQAQLGR